MSQPVDGRSPRKKAKPFCISKKEIWEAYQRVKANKGAAGTDGQSIEDFERKLKKNLYKVWNRLSRSEWRIRGNFHDPSLSASRPSHNCNVELVYRRRTRRVCSLFQRLALPQRLLLLCAKSVMALTMLESSVCQNDERPRLSVPQKS